MRRTVTCKLFARLSPAQAFLHVTRFALPAGTVFVPFRVAADSQSHTPGSLYVAVGLVNVRPLTSVPAFLSVGTECVQPFGLR